MLLLSTCLHIKDETKENAQEVPCLFYTGNACVAFSFSSPLNQLDTDMICFDFQI